MWKPFKYNMRLVTFLLLIQMGYILAKAIENPRSCNDSPENDPRLKRSDEKEIHFDSEDTAGKDFDDVAIRKTFSKPNNDNNHDITNNDNENSNEFASNSNTLPQKFPLVNNATKFPANVEERDIVTDRLTTTKDAPLQQPVYYQPIDPKYLIISGLSLPKPTKNITNASKSEDPVNIDVKETIATPINYSNLIKAMNVSNRDEENDNVRKKVIINDADTDTDVSNIRELREHLLDHLLDYFLNIIKEENYIRNDTRKKNGKDRMKVEEKLRNYYDPHHLDMFFDDDNDDDDDSDDDDYYDNNLDNFYNRRSNDSEEDLLDNVKNKELKKENITNFDPHNTLADEVDQNTPEAYTSPEYLQNEALNLKQNLNGESFKVNSSTPSSITSKYVNLIKQENDLSNTLLNITEKPGEAFDSNVNIITTTERSISNEALNEKAAEIDTDLLKYSREAVSDRIEYVYDNGALIVNEYTSFEDYIDSDEFEVVKNVTVHENNRNPIVITTENGRTKNALGKEKHIANVTLNETYNNKNNSQIRNNTTTSKDIASERQDKLNELAILDLPNKNINDNSPCNEENLAQSKNKHSLKNSKQGIKRKLRNNKNCGKLVNKNNKLINKKSKKHNCRKSIILNLNINLIFDN